ncbi:hypothetical protein C6497_06985 [Candidatus Poribacteria bacterium]|nr:MAG: hypothetical protein C6497_06985 [Candidatus Poribacteria bacterium]
MTVHPKIRISAILVGLLLVGGICAISPYNNYFLENSRLAGNHLPVGSILGLLLLVFIVNLPLRFLRWSRQFSFTSLELTVIWMMLIVAVGIPSMGLLQFLIPCLVALRYFTTPVNDWAETLQPQIPDWLVVTDTQAVTDFYEGLSPGGNIPWVSWINPLLVWGLFVVVFYFTVICLSTILRKQWVERERFSFPLIQIPIQLASEPANGSLLNSFFKNKLLWIGMILPLVIHFLNGLHAHFPMVPRIPMIFEIHRAFTEKPWHTLGMWPGMNIAIYFSVIGVASLLTLEVSFSLWFFFLFFKLQYLIMNITGVGIGPWVSCSRQVMGGYLVFVPAVFWGGREHILSIIKRACGMDRNNWKNAENRHLVDDSNEPLSYRIAFFGFVFGFVILVTFLVIAGIKTWVAIITLLSIFVTSVVLSWMVVNGGLLLVQAPFFPSDYITYTLGSGAIGQKSLAVLSFQRTFLRDWGEFMMPNFLHSFKAADEVGLIRRKVVPILGVSIVVALVVSVYASLTLVYNKGALFLQNWSFVNAPRGYFNRMNKLIQFPVETNWGEVYSMIAGAGFTGFMLWMRQSFVWWSLHPIGYLLGATYPAFHLWSSVLIGWMIKYITLKFGGPMAYRKIRPIAFGLIFGEYVMVGIWMFVGFFTGIGYFALPR